MEGYGEIEKIKKESELLGKEAKEKVLQEQSGVNNPEQEVSLQKSEAEAEAQIEEVKDSVAANLEELKFAPGEELKIKQADNGGEVKEQEKDSEKVKKAVAENLGKERFSMKEGVKLKQAGNEAEAEKAQRREEAAQAERRKFVRDTFRKYGKYITEHPPMQEKADNPYNIWASLAVEKGKEEKDSVYFRQMRDAAQLVMEYSQRLGTDDDDESELINWPSEAELIDAMTRLSETAHIYYDTHRGWRAFSKGEKRKDACNKIRDITDHFFDDMGMKLNKEGLVDTGNPISLEGEDAVKAVKRVKELSSYYKKWRKHFAFNEADERANIKAKADLFAVYQHEIDVVRSVYRNKPKDMDPDIAAIIKEARYYKIQNSVLENLEKKGDIGEDGVVKLANKYTDELDYREKPEEELSEEEVDKDLSDEQKKALERIDRWFVRNYNNGGLVGRPLNIKNHHGEIVSVLMSKTKRERLFIYYLIETGARKDPKVFDAYASQTEYTPNLDKVKKQMTASKLKLMSRLVGGYVYMHKLTEALEINRDYKELIKDCAKITRIEKEGRRPEDIKDPVELRGLMLQKAYKSCDQYKKTLEKYNKAKGSEKERLKAQTEEAEGKFKADLDALIKADNAVGEAVEKYGALGEKGEKSADRVMNRQDNNKADFKDNLDTLSSGGSAAGEKLTKGVNGVVGTVDWVARKLGGEVSWRLEGSPLARVDKYANGYTASTISGLGNAMAMMYGIYNLYENGGKMHVGDKAAAVAGILKSGASSFISYRKGVELVDGFSKQIKNFNPSKEVGVSKNLKAASVITSSVGLLLNAYTMGAAESDYENANNAARYLDRKFQEKKDKFKAPENETAEQRKARLQEIKETRYERDMIKLAKNLAEHKKKYAGIEVLTNTVSMVSVAIPGLGGTIAATVGFIGGVTGSILKASAMGKIREALFDNYFHFDEFMQSVNRQMDSKRRTIHDKKTFRERMRRKLAAAAGYSDMVSAADQIAKRYADQVYSKLFGGNEVLPEDEKKGYIELVKSFGLPYDEKKRIPDARLLAKKMTGR